MIIEYSYDEQFKKDMRKLKRKDKGFDLLELDGIGDQLDVNDFSRKFFSKKGTTTADISVDSNSNVDEVTVVHYNNEISKPLNRLNAYYLLWKYSRRLFGEEVALEAIEKQLNKEIYINDFHGFYGLTYCFNFSCMDIVCQGIQFGGQTKSKPAKHYSSFMGHMIAFVTYACNNILGAVGLADLLICSAFYVEKLYKDNPNIPKEYLEKQIKQDLQAFIYQVNQPFRSSIQSPFTNVSIYDDIFLDKLCNEYIFPNGKKVKKETVKYMQEMYIDLMNEILRETPCTFPVTTACFAVDEDKNILDKKFLDYISEKNIEFGFMNIYAGKTSTLSSCCRLRSEGENEYFNMFGSGGTKIGSVSVVTLNLPRLAYTCKDEGDFLNKLEENVVLASRVNHAKRYIANKRIEQGHAPLYSLGFMSLKKQYSTCGLVGINETCEIMGYNILEKEGQDFVVRLLDRVNETNKKQQKHYNTPHNVEQVPAENSSIKVATADRILGLNKNYNIYSNQFIPLVSEADIYDRIKLQGLFDSHMTGGAIAHLNISDKITDKKFMKSLIEKAISEGVIYFAVNYNLQKCEKGHMTVGKNKKCPICGSKITDNFTRVVGFLVNTKNWHKVRRLEDYPERKWYKNG